MKTGIELISQERQEQMHKHSKTIQSDIEHNDFGELKIAAIALLEYSTEDQNKEEIVSLGHFPASWDSFICEKMAHKPYRERLVIAGALIAAEIDRIQSTK